MKISLIFLLSIALLLPTSNLQPANAAASAASSAKILVAAGNLNLLSQLRAQGARKLVDYGDFSLWRLPPDGPNQKMAGLSGMQPVSDEILLRGITLDPLHSLDQPTLSGAQTTGGGGQLWLVQFIGPVQDAWLKQLMSAGLELVAYLPNNAYVVWGQQPDQTLLDQQDGLTGDSAIQWIGAYQPMYRISPDLRSAAVGLNSAAPVEVTIQFYTTPNLPDSLKRLNSLTQGQFDPPTRLLGFSNVHGQAPASRLAEIAGWPDVFNIEGYQPPVLLDEAQGQIVAGNVLNTNGTLTPAGPGYLEWLASKGFPTNPNAYPLVDVVDDGLDSGNAANILHPDFHELGKLKSADRVTYIANCTTGSSGNGVGGHGNLNAGIVAGYNDQIGVPYEDGSGFQLGLGISPYGRMASTKVFTDTGSFSLSKCGISNEDYPALIQQIYSAGARITTNSWGSRVQGDYDIDSQAYDVLTRDASNQAGSQEMLHIFAAGNQGPGPGTINSPGTAKNVLTVGASENGRNTAGGCYNTQTSSAGNIALFSSRGPTADQRIKPELVAPGTNIQGPASQDPNYTGLYVCGRYYPAGQTLYTWSTGTSHSTPAVAGAAQLVYEYYGRVMKPGSTPSPAMLKALLLNTPRYLSGTSAGGSLPGQAQGWGGLSLGPLLDSAPYMLVDQDVILSAAGQVYSQSGQVADPARGLAISLVWTDAPGNPAAGAAWVNDLDLELVINGQVYTGNYFKGAFSAAGGGYDSRNNVETIYLPAGQVGSFLVRVIARNIAGDGLPGNADLTDQDFALVVSNGLRDHVQLLAERWSEQPGSSNQNGSFEPGETLSYSYSLQNVGSTALSGLHATLTAPNTPVNLLTSPQVFPTLAVDQVVDSPEAFIIQLPVDLGCGGFVDLNLTLNADGMLPQNIQLAPLMIGSIRTNAYLAAGLPINIPDRTSSGNGQVLVPLPIADHYPLSDLNVQVSIRHLLDDNLILSLISPSGSEILLSSQNGGTGEDYQNTLFDDQNSMSILAGTAPLTGGFRPEQALSALNSQNIAGLWNLKVQDAGTGSTGAVLSFGLIAQRAFCLAANHGMVWLPIIH